MRGQPAGRWLPADRRPRCPQRDLFARRTRRTYTVALLNKQEILFALTVDNTTTLSNIWRITAKKTDFYLEAGQEGTAHLSLHGPNDRFEGHRFHMKIDRRKVDSIRQRGDFVAHSIPRKGFGFDGQPLAHHAFLVARVRLTWQLQRPKFRHAAVTGATLELADHQSGIQLSTPLQPNSAWDIDLVVSYGVPYWPDGAQSQRDGSRLGPLANAAGMWLTGTSYHRSQAASPGPPELSLRQPSRGEEASRILAAGPGLEGTADLYWFVETITGRSLLESTEAERSGSTRHGVG